VAEDHNNEEEKAIHYESGIPIFSPNPKDKEAQEERDRVAQRTYEDRQITTQNGILLTQILLVVFGIVGAGVNFYQARIAKVSAEASLIAANASASSAYNACLSDKIARDALIEVENGAAETHQTNQATLYQAIATTESERGFLDFRTGIFQLQDGKQVVGGLALLNIGKSSVQNVHMRLRLEERLAGEHPSLTYPPKESAFGLVGRISAQSAERAPSFQAGPTLKEQSGENVIATAQDVTDFRQGKTVFFEYGTVSYADIFGVTHDLKFCTEHFQIGEKDKEYGDKTCSAYNTNDSNNKLNPLPETKRSLEIDAPEIKCIAPKS
jgi:hypothetical protein